MKLKFKKIQNNKRHGYLLINFLNLKKTFSIDNKDVIDYSMSSSGGCDVLLKYSGGTTQKLELEHDWKNYLDHKHHENNAWSDAWLFAEQEWNPIL